MIFQNLKRWALATLLLSQVTLTAQEAPHITKHPLKASLTEGERLEIFVSTSGDPTPDIQWYFNGDIIPGATSYNFIIESVVVNDSGRYYATATNEHGVEVSEHARVAIREDFLDKNVARQWNEEIMAAIRTDYPAPVVHSRNLFSVSAAMYDAWSAYDYEREITETELTYQIKGYVLSDTPHPITTAIDGNSTITDIPGTASIWSWGLSPETKNILPLNQGFTFTATDKDSLESTEIIFSVPEGYQLLINGVETNSYADDSGDFSFTVRINGAGITGGKSVPYLVDENPEKPQDVKAAQKEAISYAAYNILHSRYRLSPSAEITQKDLRNRMEDLGYDPDNKNMIGENPAAIGNRIAARYLAFGFYDGANEAGEYKDYTNYIPSNFSMPFDLPGTEGLFKPNEWQPLAFDFLVLQNGIVIGAAEQTFLGAAWGYVRPFALTRDNPSDVYQDPGPPPYLTTGGVVSDSDAEFKAAAIEVIRFSSWMDTTDGVMIDVSPGTRHNNTLGTNDGTGYAVNPSTGLPYEPNIVSRADYGRILAEFWADGPDSETPPGHWNDVANQVTDHPLFKWNFKGESPAMDPLEYSVKMYFALNGATSDAAIAAWDSKRKYNYTRPITMIRYMGEKGQSSDPQGPSYHEEGLPLVPGLVEVITEESSAPGERHEHIRDYIFRDFRPGETENIKTILDGNLGKIAIYSWQGIPEHPAVEVGSVDWIVAENWMPFQRNTFVTPPFAAYTSGHSTFSRAAAEILVLVTGDEYFPGGLSTFSAKKDAFLEFEVGPTEDITLTWATYYDASDEAGISRLYGGIHVEADDLNGRIMGSKIGIDSFNKANEYFMGTGQTINETGSTYEDWASELPAVASDPSDKYLDSPYTNLERYIYGLSPKNIGLKQGSIHEVSFDSLQRISSIEFEYFTGTEAQVFIELSADLETWERHTLEETLDTLINLGEGRVRAALKDVSPLLDGERRFMRLVYVLPE